MDDERTERDMPWVVIAGEMYEKLEEKEAEKWANEIRCRVEGEENQDARFPQSEEDDVEEWQLEENPEEISEEELAEARDEEIGYMNRRRIWIEVP